jgi:hypothetical protein
MTPHVRRLWHQELLRRAVASLQPGEDVGVAISAAALALDAYPPPTPEEELQLLYNSGRAGAVLRWLDEYRARLRAELQPNLDMALSLEDAPGQRVSWGPGRRIPQDPEFRRMADRVFGTAPPPTLSENEHGR